MELLKFIFFILLFIGIASSQQVATEEEEKPFLRIVAPQYICDNKEKSSNSSSDSNKLTIGLQTREGQRLRYDIKIDFIILDGFKSQRHTLSIWKNVRELQKKFQIKNVSDEISLRNQIEINALELTPQVVYTFKIIGYDKQKHASDEQNFTITYKGDKLEAVHSNVGDGVSLLLYGPETFYNDLELLAVAEVLFCDPVNDYFYAWTIKGLSEEDNNDYMSVKGSTLKLPSGVLTADTLYVVSVTIFNNRSQAMASLSLPIKVISKEFSLQNIPASCSIGVNKEAPYLTSLYRSSIVEDIKFLWSCSDDCSNVFINGSESQQVFAKFPNEGKYLLKTQVTIKDVTKDSITEVISDSKIIPHVEIKYFPQLPINTKIKNEVVSTLMDLVPSCTASWVIITDGDFAKPKDENLGNLGELTIKDYEEHFLQELVDYDNNTLSKDITLNIPSNSLLADVYYKFRMNIACPEPLIDTMTKSNRKNISTFFDIIVSTNEPPIALPLVVTPLEGVPMREKFTFKTGAAKDQQSDYPLKYRFGYKVDNLTVIIGSFYEYQVVQTQLPYSDAIQTFFEVSDNNNASILLHGPTVMTNLTYVFTDSEINFKLSEIQGMLKRSEYCKTLNSAVTLILTQKKYATTENAKSYEVKVYEMLKSELDSLKSSQSATYVYHQKVMEFVKMSKNLISIMTVYDEAFIENILGLTESSSLSSSRTKRMALSNGLRNKGIMTPDPEYIKNVLSLSDLLLSSSNSSVAMRERRKYVDKIHQFVKALCHIQNLNLQLIESKFAVFEVSKIYSRQLFDEPQKFSHESTNIVYSPNSAFPAKFLCIGKIRYMLDMFDASAKAEGSSVYETRIFDDNGSNEKVLVQSEIIGEYATMEIPIKTDSDELACSIWFSEKWNESSCEKVKLNSTSKVVCKCKTPKDSVVIKYDKSSIRDKKNVVTTESSKVTESTLKFGDLTSASTIKVATTTEYNNIITLTSENPVTEMGNLPTAFEVFSSTPNSAVEVTTKNSEPITDIESNLSSATSESIKMNKTSSGEKGVTKKETGKSSDKSTPPSTAIKTNGTTDSASLTTNNASFNWVVISLLCLFFLIIIVLILLHRFGRLSESFINLPMRHPSKDIKYAKYHDEFIMRG